MESEFNLEPIVEYQMTEEEASAYKIGILWMYLSSKYLEDYGRRGFARMSVFPKKGDPRKSSLFKYCWKMQQEIKGLIKPADYKLFIAAQLQLLKSANINGQNALIGPWCLLGKNAWTRWKIWKSRFEKVSKIQEIKTEINLTDIKNELIKSQKYLNSKFSNEEEFKNVAKDIERAINLGKVSGYYAKLSPWVQKYCHIDIDMDLYKTTNEVLAIFKTMFPNESISIE